MLSITGITSIKISSSVFSWTGVIIPALFGALISIEICSEQALSVTDFELSDLRVYPNPNNGSFNVGFSPKSGQDISIEVYDIRGRAIYSKTYGSVSRFDEVIQLNDADSGVYLLSIADGSQKVTKKIVVN